MMPGELSALLASVSDPGAPKKTYQQAIQEENLLLKPSTDPTQWIFHGHPCGSVIWDETARTTASGPLRQDANVLQIAVARLLGYHWPGENEPDMELAAGQREWVTSCLALEKFADNGRNFSTSIASSSSSCH